MRGGVFRLLTVMLGAYAPRVRSLKVSFAPFPHLKLHRNLHSQPWRSGRHAVFADPRSDTTPSCGFRSLVAGSIPHSRSCRNERWAGGASTRWRLEASEPPSAATGYSHRKTPALHQPPLAPANAVLPVGALTRRATITPSDSLLRVC